MIHVEVKSKGETFFEHYCLEEFWTPELARLSGVEFAKYNLGDDWIVIVDWTEKVWRA